MKNELEKQYIKSDIALSGMLIGGGIIAFGIGGLLLTGNNIVSSYMLYALSLIAYPFGASICIYNGMKLASSENKIRDIKDEYKLLKKMEEEDKPVNEKKAKIIYENITTYDEVDSKIHTDMEVTDFYQDTLYDYGAIFGFVIQYMEDTKKDILTVCKEFNLSLEDILIVYLNMAKTYYTQGDISNGDKFLNEVRRCKYRSDIVNSMMDEIQSKRKFYQYRDNSKKRVLSLDIKAKSLNLK